MGPTEHESENRAERQRLWRTIAPHAPLALVVLLGALYPLYLVVDAQARNGFHGFPLDDPWIHLTYARNLIEHGVFAYFPTDPSTAGSTSPLYTLSLAAGMLFTGDEKLLSYALGLTFHLAFLATLAGWATCRLKSRWWAAAVVAVVAVDGRAGLLAVSGMETALFLFLLAAACWAHARRAPVSLAAALGLAVWVRPDALILVVVVVIALLVDRFWTAEPTACSARRRKRWLGAAALLALLLGGYLLFNFTVGGAALPNTFAAKTAYYRLTPRDVFLERDLLVLLTSHGWLVLLPFALGGIGAAAWRLAHRRGGTLAECGWAVALPLAYAVMLPYAHRFQRYLIPALPAVALLAIGGLQQLLGWLRDKNVVPRAARSVTALVVLGLLALLHLPSLADGRRSFVQYCGYHHQRHERVGRWIATHTPQHAVVATHDIGAIAFYGRRKVVDIVGLVLPEAIAHLHTPGYVAYLEQLFRRQRVSHLASLRRWLEVDNVSPLFVADPRPELMEVYRWIPGRTHIVPPLATRARQQAEAALKRGAIPTAIAGLRRALALDPRSARSWTAVGVASELTGRPRQAVAAYREALKLHPEQPVARDRLAALLGAATSRPARGEGGKGTAGKP